uniref:Uncharacterized protein n=1 Tax=Pygocentrus nattereri TaxID=42514 RepID=A0A3B4C4D6_PYGNA
MTLPRAESDRLILAASFRRSPLTPVLACRSLPARSTRLSLPTRMWLRPSGPGCPHSTVMVKMACERELCSFMLVKPTERARFPAFITCSISFTFLVTKDERSRTYMPDSGLSFSSSFLPCSLD